MAWKNITVCVIRVFRINQPERHLSVTLPRCHVNRQKDMSPAERIRKELIEMLETCFSQETPEHVCINLLDVNKDHTGSPRVRGIIFEKDFHQSLAKVFSLAHIIFKIMLEYYWTCYPIEYGETEVPRLEQFNQWHTAGSFTLVFQILGLKIRF